jgi:predicted RNA binding protein YcfA (HicA-like mRNA interferase family)
MKVREVMKRLENEGWRLVRTKGSHRQFRHSTKPGTVTIAGRHSTRNIEQYP